MTCVISLGGGGNFGDEIREIFSETGLLSKSPDFEYRAEQQQMAGEVAEALDCLLYTSDAADE